ncbi:MAG: 4Fe-4S binding protein [Planctomycetes bacterium]|nr:4Fe-4S binding protein [Planctomycetota bacterium]
MDCNNNVTRIRREVLIRIAKAAFDENLPEVVDKIPHTMRPKDMDETRCCIYKDRAVLRYRCMAAMGFAIEDEEDDFVPLAKYADNAALREQPEGEIMTVLDIACKGCVSSRHLITDACQGCMARPCMVNCPFNAITVVKGRAQIDSSKCVDCGKCRSVCPYHAVTRIPVPCEEACPVGAIEKNGDGKARIDFEKCISCGRCMRECPFGAVMEKSQVVDIIHALKRGRPVVAMVAPAIAGQFPGDLEQIADAIMKLGFSEVVEVAYGADVTTRKEAAEFVERMEEGKPFMTTSCCPAYIGTVQKHIPELKPFVSETATPMHYTAMRVREENPEAITVFVGPCVAKRREGLDDDAVDYVMTFEELGALFVARDVEVAVCEGVPFVTSTSSEGRGFAVTGGVAAAVAALNGDKANLKSICINGLDPAALKRLRAFTSGNCPGNLVEVMACEGGCVGGAGVVGLSRLTSKAVKDWSERGHHLKSE